MQDVVIVTSASSGIGSEVSLELAERGHRVLAVGPREKLLKRLRSINPNILPVTADLNSNEGLENVRRLIERCPDQALFRQLKDEGRMIAPATVGKFISWLLTETPEKDYSELVWDIRDNSHHPHWLNGKLCIA